MPQNSTMDAVTLADALNEVSNVLRAKAGQRGRTKDAYTASPSPRLYGEGLFGLCGTNDVISALVEDDAFMNWLNWRRNNLYTITVKVLSWEGPEGASDGAPSVGYLSEDCVTPNSIEWGKCVINFYKGYYGRCGQDISVVRLDERFCESEPILRINGTLVNNNAEWQAALAGNALKNDLSMDLVIGDHSSDSGMLNGLENVVKTGWTNAETGDVCTHVDSIVIDWGNADTTGIPALLQEVIGRLRQRAKSAGGISDNDITIMVRSEMRDCIVNAFACESPCGTGDVGNPVTNIVLDSRAARDRYLVGGQNGDGYISVAGHPISFLVNDWLPVTSGGAGVWSSDVYVLVRRVGAREVLYGVYHDMTNPVGIANEYGAVMQATDGGRFLVYSKFDEACFKTCLLVRPGLVCEAPWVQARIQNVGCSMVALTPLTPEERDEYGVNFEDLYEAGAEPGLNPLELVLPR